MKLVINGEARSFDLPLTLAGLLEQLGMKQDRVAVELNHTIVPRESGPKPVFRKGTGWRLSILSAAVRGVPKNHREGTYLVNLFTLNLLLTSSNSRLKCFKHFHAELFETFRPFH